MKDIDDFVDSSDDESTVEIDPYQGLPSVKQDEIKYHLTYDRLKKLRGDHSILGKKPETHQYLTKHPALKGEKLPSKENRSPSKFPAPLANVKDISDTVPSKPQTQKESEDTVVPSFRGLSWSEGLQGGNLFISTNTDWEEEYSYSSLVFSLAGVRIEDHTKAVFFGNKKEASSYKGYDIKHLDSKNFDLTVNNEKLMTKARLLKSLFKLSDAITLPFKDWKSIFPSMRNSLELTKRNQVLTLSEIFSYIYTNNYQKFRDIFSNLSSYFDKLDDKQFGVKEFKSFFSKSIQNPEKLAASMPFLSEGQIPRHAILYAFGLKQYASSGKLEVSPLYEDKLKPKSKKIYLGKILATQNPNTLFSGEDQARFVPDFDIKYGSSIIGKTIVGEKEIQHRGANLQGKVKKSVNIKLPKFDHLKAPKRYENKYGLDEPLYQACRSTFLFLLSQNEIGKLSWMYLETVLLSHLVHFHEIQLTKYCNKMASDSKMKISWFDRQDRPIENPFAELAVQTKGTFVPNKQ